MASPGGNLLRCFAVCCRRLLFQKTPGSYASSCLTELPQFRYPRIPNGPYKEDTR